MKDIILPEFQPKKITEDKIIFNEEPKCDEGLILVYADWCPHCVNFKPTYKYLTELFDNLEKDGRVKLKNNKLISKISTHVPKLWAMNIDKHNNKPEDHNLSFVQGFPTILIVRNINGKEGKIETFPDETLKDADRERNIPNLLKIFKTKLGIEN